MDNEEDQAIRAEDRDEVPPLRQSVARQSLRSRGPATSVEEILTCYGQNKTLQKEIAKLSTGGNRYDRNKDSDDNCWNTNSLFAGQPSKKQKLSPPVPASAILRGCESEASEVSEVSEAEEDGKKRAVPEPRRHIVEANQISEFIRTHTVCRSG
ncbi:hypothetical protein SEMRO_2647_G333610.1 [Seminavis robusta]|uniref:Uncharacterized protein n=1 Tax=Seminavis robusta TaxID=568900 RepID=A0A9N8EX97_9STRA|nr:hypothetical protein SEMRO_2647_G333610.1 [Seminavis robusta]|eukprot:Sro2647_g333610.1 n/a (154) ;mRNA; f:1739-2200